MAQHSSFQIDGVNYLLESNCLQAQFPVLCNKIHRQLGRIGKKAAAEVGIEEATISSDTKINNRLVKYKLTVNPKGIKIATK